MFDCISRLQNVAPRVSCAEGEQIVQAGRVPVSLCFLMFDDQNHGFRKKSNAELFDAASILFW